MIATRAVGSSVTVTFSVRNAAGSPADADVALTIVRPDGTEPAVTVDHPGLGEYEATFACTQPGLWAWRWTASGAVTAADSGLLRVEPAQAPDLYVTVPELRAELGDVGAMAKLDTRKLERACRAASRAVDDWCSEAAPGWRRFWLDPLPTTRSYSPDGPWELLVADIGSLAGLTVTVDGSPWTLGTDFQLGPADAVAKGRAWWKLEALRYQWPVDLRSAYPTLSTSPFPYRPAAPSVVVVARHGWPAVPEPVRTAATIQAIRLFKRPGNPYGTEGISDFGPVRIARNDPDIGPLLQHYSLGPVFA